jgi:hypothetical protein
MASRQIVLKPGEDLSDAIETILVELFGRDAVDHARNKGAKLKFVITVPWPKVPKVKKEERIIDQTFVDALKALASDEEQLEDEVNKLTGPQILKIAKLLNVPMSKSSKVASLRAQLQKSLRSEIVWNSIVGRNEPQR